MPTGYTAGVQDGTITEFDQFAMQCARAFGALIKLRDEPFSAPVPEAFEPATKYSDDRLTALREERQALVGMTNDEADRAARADFDDRATARAERRLARAEHRRRYSEMLGRAEAWVPPSPDHIGLKEFMEEQLRESIDFDCNDGIEKYEEQLELKAGSDWRSDRLAKIDKDIQYHVKARAEEIARTEGRNRWLQQLRDSLKVIPA